MTLLGGEERTYVVLDSNPIVADWELRKPSAVVLKEGVRSLQYTLGVPAVVLDEVVNKFRERASEHHEDCNSALRSYRSLTNSSEGSMIAEDDLEAVVEGYRGRIRAHIENVVRGDILPYPSVEHKAVVERAISRTKPFNKNGGYRDALIWETVLELFDEDGYKVHFITTDGDFYDDSGDLHPHLEEDLERHEIPVDRLGLYRSIKGFNQECVEPDLKVLEGVREIILDGDPRTGFLLDNIEHEIKQQMTTGLLPVRSFPREWQEPHIRDVEGLSLEDVPEVRRIHEDLFYMEADYTAEVFVTHIEERQQADGRIRLVDQSRYVDLEMQVAATFISESYELESVDIESIEARNGSTFSGREETSSFQKELF